MSEINIEKSIIINGDSSIEIQNVDVSTGNLIVEFSNGQTFNAGYVKGETGTGYQDAYLQNDDLILELTDGTVNNLGNVRGEKGVGIQNMNIVDDTISFTMDNGQTTPPFQIQKNTTEVALNAGDAIITARNLVTATDEWYEVNGKTPVTLHSVDNNGSTNKIFEVTVVAQAPGTTYFIFEIVVIYDDGTQTTQTIELTPGDNLINDSGTGGSFVVNVTYPNVVQLPQPYFRFRFGTIYSDESEWVKTPDTGTRYLFDDEHSTLHPFFAQQASNKLNFPSPFGPDISKQTNGIHENASFYYWPQIQKFLNVSNNAIAISEDIGGEPTFVLTGQANATTYDVKHIPELNMFLTHDVYGRKLSFYTDILTEQDVLDFNQSTALGTPIGTRTPIVVNTSATINDLHVSKDENGNFVIYGIEFNFSENELKIKIFDLSQDLTTFWDDVNNNITISSVDIEALIGGSISKETIQGFESRPIYSQGRIYFYSQDTGIYYSCTTALTDLRTEIDFNAEGALTLNSEQLFQADGNQYNYYAQHAMFDGSICLNTQVGTYLMNIENGDTGFSKINDYDASTTKSSYVVCFNPYMNFIMLQNKKISDKFYIATSDGGQSWYNCIPNQNPIDSYFRNAGMSARTLYIDKTENSFILKINKVSDTGITPNFNPALSHAIFSYIDSGEDSMFGIDAVTNLNSQLKTFYKS